MGLAKMNLGYDGNGRVNYGLRPSWVDARSLASNTAERFNIPTGAIWVLIEASGQYDVYVSYDADAAVPAGDVTDGSASELNPGLRLINGVSQIGVISPDACKVTLHYWS